MHDKYYYEAAEMALIDTDVRRTFATGIAGFTHVVDSACQPSSMPGSGPSGTRPASSSATSTEGDFPRYGNDDDRADDIAVWLLRTFLAKIKQPPHLPRFRAHHLHPDHHLQRGLRQGHRRHPRRPQGRTTPLAPGANPSLRRRAPTACWPALNSVAKLPYHWALDGISNTQTINPDALGHTARRAGGQPGPGYGRLLRPGGLTT